MNLWTKDPSGRLTLHFHRGQAAAWQAAEQVIAVLAGSQGGKTTFGPWWLWREITRCGPGDYLAGTASYDLFKLKMLPALREVFEHVLGWGRYWAGDRILELADPATGRFRARRADDEMWARIILRSAESGTGFESATAKAAWLDEAGMDAFTADILEAVFRRLALNQGRLLLTTTVYNLGYLKTQVYDPWRAGDTSIRVVQFDSIANPTFPRAEYRRRRARMPTWKFDMFYRGRFHRPPGMIYDCFREKLHQVKRFALPDAWERFAGLDFGGVHTAAVFAAEEPGANRLFLYREYLAGGRTAVEHTQALLSDEPMHPTTWGGARSEGQWRDEFAQGGTVGDVKVSGLGIEVPPVADVDIQIQRVYGAFKGRQLFIFDDLAGVLGQIGSYSRVLDAQGEPTLAIADKASYHYLDALRYLVSGWAERSEGVFF